MSIRIEPIEADGMCCALIHADETLFQDAQSALDVLMSANYEAGTKSLVLDKRLIDERFFILSSGLAGEILQKFVNYGGRIAIYGDFSGYTSKPLHDFIRESNKGHDVFFVATQREALDRLSRQ